MNIMGRVRRAVTQPPGTLSVDRHSWWWLILGAVLLSLATFRPILPLAAWLAPVFLLRFTRTQRAVVGLSLLVLIYYGAMALAFQGVFGGSMDYAIAVVGVLPAAAYVADRLLATRLTGLPRTLVFPMTMAVLDWSLSLTPLGTGFSLAYTQGDNLPLMQLASLTGIWGITFLVTWLGPVVNDVWENRAEWRVVRPRVGLFGTLLLAAVVFGSVRLAVPAETAPSVRVAMLAADKALWHSGTLSVIDVATGTAAVREQARAEYAPVWDDLLARTRSQARAGAKIVAWSEAAAFTLAEDEAAQVERARAAAREEGIYLQIALVVVSQTDHHPYGENRAMLIDPTGTVVADYAKTVHPFGDNAVFAPGPGTIPVVDTPYGRIGLVICYDADFPALIRQAGQAGVDLLLAPSNDWEPVKVMHAGVHVLRAAEYGFALVRPTGNGITLATDPLGRVLASADYYATGSLTTLIDVPVRGVATLYTQIGDAFAYLCIAGLAGLIAAAFLRRRTLASAMAQTPAPA